MARKTSGSSAALAKRKDDRVTVSRNELHALVARVGAVEDLLGRVLRRQRPVHGGVFGGLDIDDLEADDVGDVTISTCSVCGKKRESNGLIDESLRRANGSSSGWCWCGFGPHPPAW